MVNLKYKRGRNKEYRIRERLLYEEGYDIVQRSAGSRSPIDIWAIRKKDKKIKLVQSKHDDLSETAKKKLEKENEWLNGEFTVSFEVE